MIESITLTDFRNHTACRVTTHGRRNVIITGPNGAGKTAILEAVSMLSGDRGLRGAPMTDVARFNGAGGFSVFAHLADETEVSVTYTGGDTNRRARIDGDAAPLSDLSGLLRVVWLTPREDRLFVDSASERRAFFDRLAASFDAAHAGRTARLSKLMSERAYALKSGADTHWLDAIDAQISGTAVAVSAARIQYAGELNYFLSRCAVSCSGVLEQMLISGVSAGDAERRYMDYLRQNRTLINDKMVLDGPHKSDFGVFNNDLNLPANLTSTGQQKTVLLDLVLAHAKLVHAKTGGHCLILLDEAAAHLDKNAREKLFCDLADTNAQVWATGLDASVFENVPNAVFVACHDGEINNILTSEK
ncbi:MAG: DNA replication/repair protein RecF [Alphaproteobacteria bacterium]|nr:DNA replication/repair protein RecF [Alphaproteobacteria bacterium]